MLITAKNFYRPTSSVKSPITRNRLWTASRSPRSPSTKHLHDNVSVDAMAALKALLISGLQNDGLNKSRKSTNNATVVP